MLEKYDCLMGKKQVLQNTHSLLLTKSLIKIFFPDVIIIERCEIMKQVISKAILEDCNDQFYWTLISQDTKILDIADMWVTIHGLLHCVKC